MDNTQLRPGMPPIVPSGDPQPAHTPEAASAVPASAKSFAADFLAGSLDPRPPSAPQPVTVAPPASEPPPAPPAFDRYASAPPDPLSSLEQIPALEPVADTPPPQGMGDKANYAFAELKAKFHASRKQAEEFRDKYNALVESTKGFTADKASFADQLNKKDAEIKQLQDDLGRIELSRSSAFQEKYDVPLNRKCAEIAEVLTRNGMSGDEASDKAYQLVTASPEDVSEAVATLPVMAQGEIGVYARDARKMLADREAELAEWRKSKAGLEEVEARSGDIRYAQHMAEMADKAMDIVRGLAPDNGQLPAYAVVDPEFSASRDERASRFKDWLSRAPEDQRYAAMFEGFMAPKTYEMLQQTMIENAQLKQMLSARSSYQLPPSVPSHILPPPPPPPPPPKPEPFADAVASNSAQAFAGDFLRQMMA